MITAGLDIGARTTHAVILKDDEILARASVLTGFEQQHAAGNALAAAMEEARIARGDIARIVATGAGRQAVTWADAGVTEISADARGITFLYSQVRTVIDIGAEEARVIRCTPDGRVADFAVNEKCAAGAGTFVETMARALEVSLEDMGELSRQSTAVVPMNAQCTVFAESEVVSLIHQKTSKADIVSAVHDAIARRTVSMARRIGAQPDIALAGGLARNAGFVDALKRGLGTEILAPSAPEFVGALGAALIAKDNRR